MIGWLIPIPVAFVALWCLGGQIKTYWRRFVLPVAVLALSMAYLHFTPDKHWYVGLPALLFIPDFIEGYGPKSWIYKWLRNETEVRMAYGAMCSLPIIGTAMWTGHWWCLLISVVEPALFVVELGSWGKIGKYDILGDDVVRALGLGIFWVWAII